MSVGSLNSAQDVKVRIRTLLRASDKYLPKWTMSDEAPHAGAVCVYRSKKAYHVIRMVH